MRRGYGQYCPPALATELLCRRWAVPVVSRLLDGCTTFNEIHRAWRGFRDLEKEIRTRHIRLSGPRELKRAFRSGCC